MKYRVREDTEWGDYTDSPYTTYIIQQKRFFVWFDIKWGFWNSFDTREDACAKICKLHEKNNFKPKTKIVYCDNASNLKCL